MAYQLTAFRPPADQQDLPTSQLQDEFDELWSLNVDGFVQQAIVGNPRNGTYQADQTSYYNELDVAIPSTAAAVLVSWNAFPNRLRQYFGTVPRPRTPISTGSTSCVSWPTPVS